MRVRETEPMNRSTDEPIGHRAVVRLKAPTSPLWTEAVLRDFDSFLQDHAHCERKASGSAMNMLSHYPDRAELVAAMVDLAREELQHFSEVYRHMAARGLILGPDRKDPYVQRLTQEFRKGSEAYFLDRLLVAGILESRGCERFGLVASALPPGELKDFYLAIARSEARHQGLFVDLALLYFDRPAVDTHREDG